MGAGFRVLLALVGSVWAVPAGSQTLPDDPAAQAEAVAQVERMLPEISRLSGLPVRGTPGVEFRDLDFFRDYYRDRLFSQYPPPRRAAVQTAYEVLGLVAPGTDLFQAYLDSFLDSVEGFYDPDRRTLVLAQGLSSEDRETVLAHELTHALQDQDVPLGDYFGKDPGSLDSQFAKAALLEGQAVAVAQDYALERSRRGLVGAPDPSGAPPPDAGPAGQGDFAYRYGPDLFRQCVREAGLGSASAFLRRPPQVTEEVLHPRDYLSGRKTWESIRITGLTEGPLAGGRELWEDSLGEYGLALVLARRLPEDRAREAVRGWKGDRLQLYRDAAGRWVLVGYVVMETAAQARDFGAAYGELLGLKYRLGKARAVEGGKAWPILPPGTEACLQVRGRRVLFLEGVPPGGSEALARSVWGTPSVDIAGGGS